MGAWSVAQIDLSKAINPGKKHMVVAQLSGCER